MTIRLPIAALMLVMTAAPAADGRLSMRVSPSVAFEPANLIMYATVAASEENRAIEIIADSEQFYRSSEIQLDGERAPRVSRFEFRSMPSGIYQVRAVLKGSRGEELATSRARVSVVPSAAPLGQ
jgi:hypothetical protein